MKRIKRKVITYSIDNEFYVDVFNDGNFKEFYLYHYQYGVKLLMFGVNKHEQYHSDVSLIDANIDNIIDYYAQNFMNEDLEI